MQDKNVPLLLPSLNYYDVEDGHPQYAKVIWMETLLTFNFTVVFLMMKYKISAKNSDEILKGIGLGFVLAICIATSYGSGGSLNPALGLS